MHNPVNKLGKESRIVLFHRVNFCTQGVVNPTVLSISKLIDRLLNTHDTHPYTHMLGCINFNVAIYRIIDILTLIYLHVILESKYFLNKLKPICTHNSLASIILIEQTLTVLIIECIYQFPMCKGSRNCQAQPPRTNPPPLRPAQLQSRPTIPTGHVQNPPTSRPDTSRRTSTNSATQGIKLDTYLIPGMKKFHPTHFSNFDICMKNHMIIAFVPFKIVIYKLPNRSFFMLGLTYIIKTLNFINKKDFKTIQFTIILFTFDVKVINKPKFYRRTYIRKTLTRISKNDLENSCCILLFITFKVRVTLNFKDYKLFNKSFVPPELTDIIKTLAHTSICNSDNTFSSSMPFLNVFFSYSFYSLSLNCPSTKQRPEIIIIIPNWEKYKFKPYQLPNSSMIRCEMDELLLNLLNEGRFAEGRYGFYPHHSPFSTQLQDFYSNRVFNAPANRMNNTTGVLPIAGIERELAANFPNFNLEGLSNTPEEFYIPNRNSSGVTVSYTLPTLVCNNAINPLEDDIMVNAGLRRSHYLDSMLSLLESAGMNREPATIPYTDEVTTRNDTEGAVDNGWFQESDYLGEGVDKRKITIMMPPRIPTIVIIGASHSKYMSLLNLNNMPTNNRSERKLIEIWKTVCFVRIPGSYSEFKRYRDEILAFILSRLYGRYRSPSIQPTTHIMLAMIPFSWDIANPSISTAMYAESMMETADFFLEKAFNTDGSQLSFQFLELPIRHKFQLTYMKANCVIREINKVIDPAIAPARIWVKRMRPIRKGEQVQSGKRCRIPGKLDFVLQSEHHDTQHLAPDGYLAWVACIVNSAVLGNADYDAQGDFTAGKIISTPQSESNYFKALRAARSMAAANIADYTAAVAYRRLRDIPVDVYKLDSSYPTHDEIQSSNNRLRSNQTTGSERTGPYTYRGANHSYGRGRHN